MNCGSVNKHFYRSVKLVHSVTLLSLFWIYSALFNIFDNFQTNSADIPLKTERKYTFLINKNTHLS